MFDNDFNQRAFKRITERCAAKIKEAHRVADEQRKYVEFIQSEINNGADTQQAINTAIMCWKDDIEFLEEVTQIIEEVASK